MTKGPAFLERGAPGFLFFVWPNPTMDTVRCAHSPISLEDSVLQTTCNGASPPDPLLAFFKINALKP